MKKERIWILGIVLSGILAAFGKDLYQGFKSVLPVVEMKELFEAEAPGEKYTVVVSNFINDPRQVHTNRLATSLSDNPRINLVRTQRTLRVEPVGLQSAARKDAIKEGSEILESWNGDLLIWGEVIKDDHLVALWLLGRTGDLYLAGRPYELDEVVIPAEFEPELDEIITHQVFANLLELTKSDELLVNDIEQEEKKLSSYLDHPPESVPAREKAALHGTLAMVQSALGGRQSDSSKIMDAIGNYEKAVSFVSKEEIPRIWKHLKLKLGRTYVVYGEFTSDEKFLRKGISTYREVQSFYSEIGNLSSAALIEVRIGKVYQHLSEDRGSISSFSQALRMLDKSASPSQQQCLSAHSASIKHNLACAYLRVGERGVGIRELQAAEGAFREALKKMGNEKSQVRALAQRNLAETLVSLGNILGKKKYFEDALLFNSEAAKYISRDNMPQQWLALKRQRGKILYTLGMKSDNRDLIKKGICELQIVRRQAVKSESEEDELDSLAMLGNAYFFLAKLDRHEELFRLSSHFYSRASALDWEGLRHLDKGVLYLQLGRSFYELGVKEGSLVSLDRAKENYKMALTQFREAGEIEGINSVMMLYRQASSSEEILNEKRRN